MLILCIGMAMATFGLAGNAEADILPGGNLVTMSTGSASFVAGSTSINCKKSEGQGVNGWTYVERTPLNFLSFEGSSGSECETTGMGGVKFKVVTTSSKTPFELIEKTTTSASLNFTYGGTPPIEYISGSCVIKGKADAPTATWTDGKAGSPTATPGSLTFASQKLNVVSEEESWKANCPAALVSALAGGSGFTFSATYSVADTTYPSSAVTFTPTLNMLPKGQLMKMSSSNILFTAGTTQIICRRSEGHGVIGGLAAGVTPVYNLSFEGASSSECETAGMGGIKFKVRTTAAEPPFRLIGKSTSSAALTFSYGSGPPIEYISGSCVIKGKSDSPTGSWTNGTSGSPTAFPSKLAITSQKLFVVAEEANWKANCPAALASALTSGLSFTFSATYTVTDQSVPASAVLLELLS